MRLRSNSKLKLNIVGKTEDNRMPLIDIVERFNLKPDLFLIDDMKDFDNYICKDFDSYVAEIPKLEEISDPDSLNVIPVSDDEDTEEISDSMSVDDTIDWQMKICDWLSTTMFYSNNYPEDNGEFTEREKLRFFTKIVKEQRPDIYILFAPMEHCTKELFKRAYTSTYPLMSDVFSVMD